MLRRKALGGMRSHAFIFMNMTSTLPVVIPWDILIIYDVLSKGSISVCRPFTDNPVIEKKTTSLLGGMFTSAPGIAIILIAAVLLSAVGAGDCAAQVSTNVEGGNQAADVERNGRIQNVFIIVIDGLRNQEAVKDPTRQYIPRIWNDLKPLGTVYTDIFNHGRTLTSPGHACMTSGVAQIILNSADPYEIRSFTQEEPSIFQYYRAKYGLPQDETWIINGKGNTIYWVGFSQNPYYAGRFEPHVTYHNLIKDDVVQARTEHIIDTYHPSLVMVNLKDVDHAGHTGDWDKYISAIQIADNIVYELCQKILNDPVYKDNTAIIITSDHGRHTDGIFSGFEDHGCYCLGCREVFVLAIGPGIKKNVVVETEGYLRDIAHTVGYMLDFDVPFGNGSVLREMFVNPLPPRPALETRPAIACEGSRVHIVFNRMEPTSSSIVYVNSQNGGLTWGPRVKLSSNRHNFMPDVTADGNKVAVAYSTHLSDGYWRVAMRESDDFGATWGDEVPIADKKYAPQVRQDYSMGLLNIVWDKTKSLTNRILLGQIQDSTPIAGFNITSMEMLQSADCEAQLTGTHVLYNKYDTPNDNWNIEYSMHDGVDWSAPIDIAVTPNSSLHPDIVVDGTGVHAIWAENHKDTFKIVIRNSIDGSAWDSAAVIAGQTDLGAWHPRIAAGNDCLVIVWEGYEGPDPGIYCAKSSDGGVTWSAPVRISDEGTFNTYPAVAIDAQNVMHVVWMKGHSPSTVTHRRFQL